MENIKITYHETLRNYLNIIFSYKFIYIIMLIALIVPAYIWMEMKTPVYQASVKMYVKAFKATESDYYRALMGQNLVNEHAELVNSKIVLTRVVEALKLYEIPFDYEKKFASPLKVAWLDYKYSKRKKHKPYKQKTEEEGQKIDIEGAVGELSAKISIAPVMSTNFFLIKVKDFNPSKAVIYANSISRSYVIFDMELQIQEYELKYGEKNTVIWQLEKHINEFKKTLHGEPLLPLEAIGPASIKIVSQANGAHVVRQLNKKILIIMLFGSSIFISTIFAFLLNYLDQTIKSTEEAEELLGVPILNSIPKRRKKDKPLITDTSIRTKYAQAFFEIAEDIFILTKNKGYKSILITDATVSEETSVVISNISIYLSKKIMQNVLIIDANIKAPTLSKVFNIDNSPGLVDIFEGKTSLENSVRSQPSDVDILTSGGSVHHSSALLECSKMEEIMTQVKQNYSLILVNYACLKRYCDAVVLSSIADCSIIIVNEQKTRKGAIINAINFLKQKNIPILGAILNGRSYNIPKYIYKIT